MNDLNNDMKDLLRNINLRCVKINEHKNLNCTFKKVDFLEKRSILRKIPKYKV